MVHLLPLGIAADKSGSRVSHLLNASTVVALGSLLGLEPPAALKHPHCAKGWWALPSLPLRWEPGLLFTFSLPSISDHAVGMFGCKAPKWEWADGLQPLLFPFCLLQAILLLEKLFPSVSCLSGASSKAKQPCLYLCEEGIREWTGELFCPHCQHFTCLVSAGKKETASESVIVARSQLPGLPCCRLGTVAAELGMEHQSWSGPWQLPAPLAPLNPPVQQRAK